MIFKSINTCKIALGESKQRIISYLIKIVEKEDNKYYLEKVYIDPPKNDKFFFNLKINNIGEYTFEIQKIQEIFSKKIIASYIVNIKDSSTDDIIVNIKSIAINDKVMDSYGVNIIYDLVNAKYSVIESLNENAEAINILNNLK